MGRDSTQHTPLQDIIKSFYPVVRPDSRKGFKIPKRHSPALKIVMGKLEMTSLPIPVILIFECIKRLFAQSVNDLLWNYVFVSREGAVRKKVEQN